MVRKTCKRHRNLKRGCASYTEVASRERCFHGHISLVKPAVAPAGFFVSCDVVLWVLAIVAVVNDSAAHDTSAKRISTGRTCAERARAGRTRVEYA